MYVRIYVCMYVCMYALLEKLTNLFSLCWEKGVVSKDIRDAVIVSLYTNKGKKSDCSNYRGITLLFIAGKILARVLLDRLIPTIAARKPSREASVASEHCRHDLRAELDSREEQGAEYGIVRSFH